MIRERHKFGKAENDIKGGICLFSLPKNNADWAKY